MERAQGLPQNTGNESEGNAEWLQTTLGLLVLFVMIQLILTLQEYAEFKEFQFLKGSSIGVLLGIAVGGLIVLALGEENNPFHKIEAENIFLVLYPSILIHNGYRMHQGKFLKRFKYIAAFGLCGAVLNFLIMFGLTVMVNALGLVREFNHISKTVDLPIQAMALFSASMIANESESALEILHQRQYNKLRQIFVGETMLNETMAIVIFATVLQVSGLNQTVFNFKEAAKEQGIVLVLLSIAWFLLILSVSVIVGALWGTVCTLYFKHFRFMTQNTTMETLGVVLFGFCAYVTSESDYFSGALSVLVYSVFVGHYNTYNLSPAARVQTAWLLQTLSLFCVSVVYLFIGAYTWNADGEGSSYAWSWTFFLAQLIIIPLARFLSTSIVHCFFLWFHGKNRWYIDIKEHLIIVLGGLARGGLAFGLMFSFKAESIENEHEKQSIQILQSSALFLTAFMTVVYNSLSNWLVHKIEPSLHHLDYYQRFMKMTPEQEFEVSNALFQDSLNYGGGGGGGATPYTILLENGHKKLEQWFHGFDERCLKPFLIYDYARRKDEIRKEQQILKINKGRMNEMADTEKEFLIAAKAELDSFGLNSANISFAENTSVRAVRRNSNNSVIVKKNIGGVSMSQKKPMAQPLIPIQESAAEEQSDVTEQIDSIDLK